MELSEAFEDVVRQLGMKPNHEDIRRIFQHGPTWMLADIILRGQTAIAGSHAERLCMRQEIETYAATLRSNPDIIKH